jgi:undecaprenyl-diphosphatase
MKMKALVSWSISLITCFGLLAWAVFNPLTTEMEKHWMFQIAAERTSGWTMIWKVISEFGSAKVMIVLLLAYAAYGYFTRRQVWGPTAVFCAVLGGLGLNTLMKLWFERPRPAVEQLIEANGFSFPSSNSVMAITFYGMLAFVAASSITREGLYLVILRRSIFVLSAIIIASIGIARIYLGVHYPTDIAAGLLIGSIWLVLCVTIYRRLRAAGIVID